MKKQAVKEYLIITLGIFIMALGIYFFKFLNNFSTGGVSGISILLSHYYPNITPGTVVFVINLLLLGVGFLVWGKSFGVRTAYSSILLSVLIGLFEIFFPMHKPLTDETMLELVFSVALPAIGSAMLFNVRASSGGTDIVAMLLKKKTNINIGQCLLGVDLIIAIMALITFGPTTGLASLLGLAMKAVIVDLVLDNIKMNKCFHIVTSKGAEISEFIVKTLKRSATAVEGEGVYTHDGKSVLLVVVNRSQAVALSDYAKSIDPSCFIIINNTSDIIGKGFRSV